jgi:hypothetical protein
MLTSPGSKVRVRSYINGTKNNALLLGTKVEQSPTKLRHPATKLRHVREEAFSDSNEARARSIEAPHIALKLRT